MKRIQSITMLVSVSILALVSCDSYLDKGPEENMSLPEAFAERLYTERFLNNIYSGIPNEMDFHNFAFNPFVGGSDEMEVTFAGAVAQLINNGSLSPANNLPIWGRSAEWSRKCNLFLEHIQYTDMSPEAKSVWIGEVHFLRAFFNFLALRMYGPIPIYDHSLDPGTDFTTIERGTYQECVDFIVRDCDEAYRRLPARQNSAEYGRATAAAALALKSRLLLYAASPQFNGNPDYRALVNSAGEQMFPEYARDRWAKAAEAAKLCIDFSEGNLPGASAQYQLYEAASGNPADSHYELFTKNWNQEVLFASNIGTNMLFEQCIHPKGLNGFSFYAPTQQMVDAYRMADGSHPFELTGEGQVAYSATGQPTIVPGSGYTESGFADSDSPDGYWTASVSNMYVNREPRFYAHINFAGSLWRNYRSEFWYTGNDGLQQGGANHSKTGYVIRKFADKNTNLLNQVITQRTWIWFRLGEIYLNYAEALNEAHDQVHPDVYIYLNKIRRRGGLPELIGPHTPQQMRMLIRQERRVELAFETHRFFDSRRWLIADQTDGNIIYGLNIGAGNSLTDPEFYQRTPMEKRTFVSPRNYLFPIPESEIQIVPALVQNPGF